MEALKAKAAAQAEAAANRTAMSEVTDAEITYTANATTSTSGQTIKIVTGTGPKKKAGKPKLTAKEKKERSVSASSHNTDFYLNHTKLSIEKIISCLPLEFRGSDPVRTLTSYPTKPC